LHLLDTIFVDSFLPFAKTLEIYALDDSVKFKAKEFFYLLN
jgi:hypothetical protein